MTATTPPQAGNRPAQAAAARSQLRSVAMPTEHGGWGLTLEPALLGLIVAPSIAGLCLAVAALLAFLARTPLKLVLVDRWRGRHLERTALAGRVAAAEVAAIALLAVVASVQGDDRFWIPVAVAAPLVAVELWFDMRSRSRRLVPELAGALGISAVVAMIVLADEGAWALAIGLWLVVAARAATTIPYVRAQVTRLHGRPHDPRTMALGDAGAVALAAAAVVSDRVVLPGSLAVAALVVLQRATWSRPVPPAKVLGIRQMVLGLVVVAITAAGALAL